MKSGLQCSGSRKPIETKFCRGGHVRTKMYCASFGGFGFIGLGAVEVHILGFPSKTYIAHNNLPTHYRAGM